MSSTDHPVDGTAVQGGSVDPQTGERAATVRILFKFTRGLNDPRFLVPEPGRLLEKVLGPAALATLPPVAATKLFAWGGGSAAAGPDALSALIRQAVARDPLCGKGFKPDELHRWFALDVAGDDAASALLAALAGARQGEAYKDSPVLPGGRGLRWENLDFRFLEDAPLGVGARHAWAFPGGRGAGVRFVDVEVGWDLANQALADLSATMIAGRSDPKGEPHGTAVLAVVAKPDAGDGFAGIACDATSVRVISTRDESDLDNLPRAIVHAARELRFGDVLLIEVSTSVGSCNRPVEVQAASFEAIRLATALGILVVEPAGNSCCNLAMLREGLEGSGALVVGAGAAEGGHACLFNFGRRVDCYAWGERIGTIYFSDGSNDGEVVPRPCLQAARAEAVPGAPALGAAAPGAVAPISGVPGGTDLAPGAPGAPQPTLAVAGALVGAPLAPLRQIRPAGPTRPGTDSFSGTSGAAAIIAGVVMVIQGLAQTYLRFRFSPWQMALLLRDPANGTPSADGEERPIGLMPDLRKILDTLGIPAVVYLRDHEGDDGDDGEQPRGLRWASPDILLREREMTEAEWPRVADGGAAAGALGGLGLARGVERRLYLRARNRGGEEARRVKAAVYWSPVATFLSPRLWLHGENRVGEVVWPHIPTGDQAVLSEGLGWQETCGDRAWIACLLPGDQRLPKLGELTTWEEVDAFLRSRRVACRNLHEVRCGKHGLFELPFLMPGLPRPAGAAGDSETRLEVLSRLPREARVWLEVPGDIADLGGTAVGPPIRRWAAEDVFLPVNPCGRHYFRAARLAADEDRSLHLVVKLPETTGFTHEIAVRQMFGAREVGRVTWRLAG